MITSICNRGAADSGAGGESRQHADEYDLQAVSPGQAIRLKGREIRFTGPRAIPSGIGMVHRIQLVNVMTVAENVVLGEEETVAYGSKKGTRAQVVLKWLSSIVVFLFIALIGLSLGEWEYFAAGLVIGAASGIMVAFPPVARFAWGIGWRIGLAFAALAIASQVGMVTRVGLTAAALRQEVETFDEKRPQVMDGGYTVKAAVVQRARIEFDWSKEHRDADSIDAVIERAKEKLEPFRDQGIPGWLIDAIDDAPPVVQAFSVFLLMAVLGAHSIRSWRGFDIEPGRLYSYDLAVIAGLVLVYAVLAWVNLDDVSTMPRAGLLALTALALVYAAWRTFSRRYQPRDVEPGQAAPLDGVMDSFLLILENVTEIGNEHAAAERVRELSRLYGLEVDPDAVIEKLPVGQQQRVEIVKALYRKADILILDEPTAVLTPQEGRELFKIMRELAAQGVSIIFITHKLKEVFEVATHIVVMRDGRVVGTTTPDQATEASLAAMMVGREVILQVDKDEARPAESVLDVRDVSALDDRGAQALNHVNFDVRAGEVMGIAGVQGNGQTELVEVLTGLRAATSGSVNLLGTELQPDEQPEGDLGLRAAAFVIDMLIVAVLAYFFGYFTWYFSEESLQDTSAAARIVAG
jgi:ABC-type multidrug transport system ATPase subunit